LLVVDKETVTCALNLRSHHPAFINAGVAELQRPISSWGGGILHYDLPAR